MAEESKIQITLNLNADKASATLRNFKGDIVASKIPLSEVRKEFGNFVLSAKETQRTITTTRTSFDNLGKSIGGFRTASGSAASSALELGRIVSDMPYGIRGVANNMSQFASQMMFSATTVDQATGKIIGLSGAVKNLWAALLGPLGVLLAIQAVIAAFDYFAGGSKKAEKQVDSFNDALVENSMKVEKMRALKGIVDDNTSSIETQKDALEELKTLGFDPAKKSLDEFIESQQNLAIVNAATKAIEESLTDLMKERLKLNAKAKKELSEYYKMLEDGSFGIDIQEAVLDQLKLDKSELDKKEAELKKQFQELIKSAFDITDSKRKPKNRDRASILSKMGLFNSEKDRKEITDYLARVLGVKPFKINTELDLSFFENEKNKKETDKKLQKIFDDKINGLKEYADMAKSILSTISSFIDAEFERELTLEQNKTNSLNNELNQRLLNENLSKSERAKIQNEIAKNDEALRKKQEIIERKRFNTNKAFAIASALIDTAGSAVKAYGSQLVVGEPSSLIRAQIAAGAATALGLAQVAMIARQQFQSSAGSATPIRGLGSSGGEGDRSFNYNLVGNNQANQIAEALQGQFSNPLKAYVVSREVTTQQELDMNIKSGASF